MTSSVISLINIIPLYLLLFYRDTPRKGYHQLLCENSSSVPMDAQYVTHCQSDHHRHGQEAVAVWLAYATYYILPEEWTWVQRDHHWCCQAWRFGANSLLSQSDQIIFYDVFLRRPSVKIVGLLLLFSASLVSTCQDAQKYLFINFT